jgi:hypothetical protein
MAFKYIGNINKDIQYLCLSTDIKEDVDIGARLYISDTGVHEIWNGTAWVEYFSPNVKPAV